MSETISDREKTLVDFLLIYYKNCKIQLFSLFCSQSQKSSKEPIQFPICLANSFSLTDMDRQQKGHVWSITENLVLVSLLGALPFIPQAFLKSDKSLATKSFSETNASMYLSLSSCSFSPSGRSNSAGTTTLHHHDCLHILALMRTEFPIRLLPFRKASI